MLNTLIIVRNMILLWLTISWVSMSMCMTTPEAIQTINMANQVDITRKTARIDCEVPPWCP